MKKYEIVLLCVAGGLLLTFLFGRHEWKHIEIAPDSSMYHFLAVNMLQGKGYYAEPVGSVEEYNAQTIEKFGIHKVIITERQSAVRMPGYPLFLMLIYSIHGVDINAVLPYQLLLTGLTGALMVLTGWIMLSRLGAIAALIAVMVFGMNRDVAYPTSQLLTECLTMFLLTAAAAAAAWAQKGVWKREFIPSLLIILAVFTRPASIFIAISYGIILIFQYFQVSKKRILAYAGLCIVIILPWSIFASIQTGRFVPLTSTSSQIMYAGIDPVQTAERLRIITPEISVKSLEHFWMTFAGGPALDNVSVFKLFADIPERLAEVLKLSIIKLKAGTDWIPRSLLASMLLGISLSVCIKIDMNKLILRKETGSKVYVRQRGFLRSNRLLEVILFMAALLVLVLTLGYSSTFIQIFFWLLPVVLPFFGLEFATEKKDRPACRHSWILSWYWGYVLMCLITFSHPRLIRPHLPILYLCAAMAIPLLVITLLGLKQSMIEISKGKFLRFKDCSNEH